MSMKSAFDFGRAGENKGDILLFRVFRSLADGRFGNNSSKNGDRHRGRRSLTTISKSGQQDSY